MDPRRAVILDLDSVWGQNRNPDLNLKCQDPDQDCQQGRNPTRHLDPKWDLELDRSRPRPFQADWTHCSSQDQTPVARCSAAQSDHQAAGTDAEGRLHRGVKCESAFLLR
jgi:hypothetical protein